MLFLGLCGSVLCEIADIQHTKLCLPIGAIESDADLMENGLLLCYSWERVEEGDACSLCTIECGNQLW